MRSVLFCAQRGVDEHGLLVSATCTRRRIVPVIFAATDALYIITHAALNVLAWVLNSARIRIGENRPTHGWTSAKASRRHRGHQQDD